MDERKPVVVVFGASGLIGAAVARDLARRGFAIAPLARRFTPAQSAAFGAGAGAPITTLSPEDLARLLREIRADVVVNCIGVLQDGARSATRDANRDFVERLLAAMASLPAPALLVQISIPGGANTDATDFSRTRREAEALIAASAIPHVVLRPGFVIAPVAYGGSAMIRALAALPFALPDAIANRPFRAVSIDDVAATVAGAVTRWRAGAWKPAEAWDVMAREATSLGEVVAAFRRWSGGPRALCRLPGWLMDAGARLGDFAGRLGWSPPVRSTSLAELRRGVEGDPAPWAAATGIEPASLAEALARMPASVQELWFARLYFLKPVVFATLAIFWIVSGLISLTVAFDAAAAILTAHGFALFLAKAGTIVTSLADIGVGGAIAYRASSRTGLLAGVALSLFYLAGAALIAPDLWLEPLGSMVKTIPAIVLMLVALAILEDR